MKMMGYFYSYEDTTIISKSGICLLIFAVFSKKKCSLEFRFNRVLRNIWKIINVAEHKIRVGIQKHII